MVACSACTHEVVCERVGQAADCTINGWFLGVPSGSRQVRGVTEARLQSVKSSKGSMMSHVVLVPGQGAPVEVMGASGGMDDGRGDKDQMVVEINQFVAGRGAGPLRVRARHGFFALAFSVVFIAFASAGGVLRKLREKRRVTREQQAHPEQQFIADARPPDLKLYCRACGEVVPAGAIDLQHRMARCTACHAMFDVSSQLAAAGGETSVRQRERARVALPDGMEVQELQAGADDSMPYGGKPAPRPGFEIARRWFAAERVFVLLFALGWNVVVLRILGVPRELTSTAVMGLALVPGLSLLYFGLAGVLNRTLIRAESGLLTIRHGPLFWPGRKRIEVSRLKQLYVKEQAHRRKSGVYHTYDLLAVLDDAVEVPMVRGLPAPTQALFLEQQLETRLGIADVAVEGEVGVRAG